ncbi:MAG: polysaccharide pyruvyl transferase family protein [Candidatus Peribacteraceae bacterium]|nr:polysaccharide pyruvyl transferase family protein [Candidatus Peribacteraceae bacterium]
MESASRTPAQQDPSIALVGMFGGMWREYNPGCFWTGYKTYTEMQQRFPRSRIDAYAIDNRMQGTRMIRENPCGLLPLRFFPRELQTDLLERVLPRYDAVVVGGDIVWGGDDVVEDNPIFFAQSPSFLERKDPSLLFNCVHTFYDDTRIQDMQETFRSACRRASYISVRTDAIRQRLENLGISQSIHYVPDIVLDCNLDPFRRTRPRPETSKPSLGISVRASLADDLIQFLKCADLHDYEVSLFPFSRQYGNLKTVERVKDSFRDRYRYIEAYGDPVESFLRVGDFDTVIIDTMHGITAAILQSIPFVSLDVEPERTSRKDQLLEALNVKKERNIRLNGSDGTTLGQEVHSVEHLLKEECVVDREKLLAIRRIIQTHFDTMEKTIRTQCTRSF